MDTTGRHAPAHFAAGTRFWSEGLRAPCRVLGLDDRAMRFASESTTEPNIVTEVPLALVARHVAAGRWRLLGEAECGAMRPLQATTAVGVSK